MKSFSFVACMLLCTRVSFAQYGDAYHAPNTLRLQQMRNEREAEMKRSVSYNRNTPSSSSYPKTGTVQRNTATTQKTVQPSFNDKLQTEYNQKLSKFNQLAKGIEHTAANFNQLVGIAVAAGFDEYTAKRMLGYIDPSNKDILRNSGVGYNYKGNTKDGQPYGRGTFIFDNGDELTCDVQDGLPHGKGLMKWKNGAMYEGDIDYGEITGMGTITTPEGEKYTGRFEKGQLMEQSAGDITVMNGPKVNGKYQGDDVYVEWSSGEKFRGKVVNNVPVQGRVEYPDGYIFEGKFKTIYDWTEGKVTLPKGGSFEGVFKNNIKHQGKYTYPNGNTATGRFSDDGTHLQCGVFVTADFTYEGEVTQRNKKQGYGRLVRKNGDVYEGEFINDVQEGKGSFAFNNTKVVGKIFYKNTMVYGMAIVNGKPVPATLNKDYTVTYLPEADAAEAKQYYQEALQFIQEKRPAYEACLRGTETAVKTEEVKVTVNKPEAKTVLEKSASVAAPKTVSAEKPAEKKPEEKLPLVKKSFAPDANGVVNFSGWEEALAKLNWKNIERPKDENNGIQTIADNILVYSQQSNGHLFTTAPLGKPALANFTYKAQFGQLVMDGESTAIGLLLTTGKMPGVDAATIVFMVNAWEQQYWFGTWDEAKSMCIPLIHTNTFDGKVSSTIIHKFSGDKGAENTLALKRKGAVLELWINDKAVETIQIGKNNKQLLNVTGIGLVTADKGTGGIAEIMFTQSDR